MKEKQNKFVKRIGKKASKTVGSLRLVFEDMKNKQFTQRVKVFTAALSSAVLVSAFCILIAVSGSKSGEAEIDNIDATEEVQKADIGSEPVAEEATTPVEDITDESSTETEIVESEEMLSETEDAGEEYINETLFIGDSNTVRMMNYGITSLENTLAVVGMGIQSVKTLQCVQFSGYSSPITMVEAVKLMQPSRIIITFGTNNANGMEVDDFVKKYKEALDALKAVDSDVDILINSIPPISEKNSYPTLSQNSIDRFNNALIVLAKDNGYKYIDSASVMKDSSTGYAKKGFTVGDGIHISEDGFAAMFTYIRTHSHVVTDAKPRPVTALPKQVKATYVIDSSGKLNNDPDAYKEMSEVSKAQQEALKKALEESTKKAQEELQAKAQEKKDCQHTNYDKSVVREATVDETGLIRYTCRDCGYVYEEIIKKKEDHRKDDEAKRKAEEEQKKKAQEEEAKRAEQERQKAEQQRQEEEQRRQQEEEQRSQQEEQERQRQEEEQRRQQEEEERRRQEEEQRQQQEEHNDDSHDDNNDSGGSEGGNSDSNEGSGEGE